MHHPTDRITHTTAFVTPVVEHWLERDQHVGVPNLRAYNTNSFNIRVSIKSRVVSEIFTGWASLFIDLCEIINVRTESGFD